MRDPEMVARAGYAAARLEQAWERWRALHGLSGSADPLASYVGYSHKEPMGQPRVVIGVDAAEAEFFADFLEGHDCAAPGLGGDASASPAAGLPASGPSRGTGSVGVPSREAPGSVASAAASSMAGSAPAPREVPSEPMARLADDTDPYVWPTAERPVSGPQAPVPPATRAFPPPVPTFTPIGENRPAGLAGEPGPAEPRGPMDPAAGAQPPDVIAAELAGWASGELPGQASEQLASWAAAETPGGRELNRSRSAR